MSEEIDQLENDLKAYLNTFTQLVDDLMTDQVEKDESISKANKLKKSYNDMVQLVSQMNFLDDTDFNLLNSVKGYEALNKNAINKTKILKEELENIESVLSSSLNKINEVSEANINNNLNQNNN